MAIKLSKSETTLRNKLLFAVDAKQINIDNTFVNLFMLLKNNGVRLRQRAKRGSSVMVENENLISIFNVLEEQGIVSGFRDNPDAVDGWIRTNLANYISRGKPDKENISSLRPIHLESYKHRNAKYSRDYNSADQVYLMLSTNEKVKNELQSFLTEGWDKISKEVNINANLDVDSLGILHLIKGAPNEFNDSNSSIQNINPILKKQSEIYCDDIRRLLAYKKSIPRPVIIDYLKIITSFHLSLYMQKIVAYLPIMVKEGSTEIDDNWSIILDSTENFESIISKYAINEVDNFIGKFYEYFKATFKINSVISAYELSENDSSSVSKALKILTNKPTDFEATFKALWQQITKRLKDDDNEEEIEKINDWVKYEDSYFDKYIELLIRLRWNHQYRHHIYLFDSISHKNSEIGILAQGRSKKHPRRFVIGSKLLEALIQIMVLETKDDKFYTYSMFVEELIEKLHKRYGIIISGQVTSTKSVYELETIKAFSENHEAFKNKLRNIGFLKDMSDAFLLQKIRPRYEI